MSNKKSRPYTVDGKQYVFGFDSDNKINSIFNVSGRSGKANPLPVDPNSSRFSDLANSESGTRAYNVNRFKGSTDSYLDHASGERAVRATASELNAEYIKNTKSKTNEQFVEEENNQAKESIATQNASPKTANSVLRYPLDFDINQDHLKIVRHEYVRPGINQSKATNTQSTGTKVVKRKTASNARKYHTGRAKVNYNSVGDGVLGAPISTIFLPMPKVADVNGVEWGKSELTISGLAGLGAIAPLARFTGRDEEASKAAREALKGSQGGALEGTNVAGSSATEFRRALTAQTLSGLAGALTGSNLDADTFLARTSGRVLNPNAEVLFQGPVIRDFAFSFIMIARSQREGAEIRRIIRELKIGMAPKFRSTTFLKNPDVFSLEYKSGENTLNTVNRFNRGGLALQTMSVDYSPNGYWSAYRDSQPVQLKMDLSFTELRPIYESDQEATPEDSVGL